ncbi:MAG TPA: hypothetical protein VFE47_26995 [Tepidisphaeraceae bacterium]|jgi:hypothetical protein|nr:hypothetical protein [Tepidisphaeraceae bacterium]
MFFAGGCLGARVELRLARRECWVMRFNHKTHHETGNRRYALLGGDAIELSDNGENIRFISQRRFEEVYAILESGHASAWIKKQRERTWSTYLPEFEKGVEQAK